MVFDVLKKILGINNFDIDNKKISKGIDVANKMVIGSLEQGRKMHRQREEKINKMMKNLTLIENNTGSRKESPEIEAHRRKLGYLKNVYQDKINAYEKALSEFYTGYNFISKLVNLRITECEKEKNSSNDPNKEVYNEACKIGANLHKPYIDLPNNSGETSSENQYTTINDIEIKSCNDLKTAYKNEIESKRDAIHMNCNSSYNNIQNKLGDALTAEQIKQKSNDLVAMNKQLVKMSENLIDNIKDIENNENKQHRNQIIQTRDSIRTKLKEFRNNYDEYVQKEENSDNPFKNDALINARIHDMKFKRNAETLRLGVWMFAAIVLIVFTIAMIKRKKN